MAAPEKIVIHANRTEERIEYCSLFIFIYIMFFFNNVCGYKI